LISCPLQWPEGRKKTPASERRISTTPKTLNPALESLTKALMAMGATYVRISTNVPADPSGKRAMGAFTQQFESPGAAVSFLYHGKNYALTCDKATKVADNVHSLLRQVEALRSLEKHADRETAAALFAPLRIEIETP
jgi:hypothetical protein